MLNQRIILKARPTGIPGPEHFSHDEAPIRPLEPGELLVDYDALEILDPRFARLTLDNAPLEKLADGFRWLEGLIWMGDWDALLFQDLPNDRTMMWRESAGEPFPTRAAHGSHCRRHSLLTKARISPPTNGSRFQSRGNRGY